MKLKGRAAVIARGPPRTPCDIFIPFSETFYPGVKGNPQMITLHGGK
jgi:hypothetical protein